MSELLLFIIGFFVFLTVTTAVMTFGYFQFNTIYREDHDEGDGPPIESDGNLLYFAGDAEAPATG